MQGSTNRPVAEQQPGGSGTEDASGGQSKPSQALGTVQDHTREVTTKAAEEAKGVMEEAVDRLHGEAERQTQQVQQALQRTGSQLEALADGRVEDAGPLTDYARRASAKVDDLATRMERLGFDGIISEVATYARRRPGRFLLVSTAAGVVAGRLGRNLRAAQDGQGSASGQRPAPAGTAGEGRGPQAGRSAQQDRAAQGTPAGTGVPPGFGAGPAASPGNGGDRLAADQPGSHLGTRREGDRDG